jgi:DNA-binding beta-propeller fold protein YncE/ABC-type Fe3+ transport system permease subunit
VQRSAWVAYALGFAVAIVALVWPALAMWLPRASSRPTEVIWNWGDAPALLASTLGWAAAIALGGVVLGWAPGIYLGRRRRLLGFALIVAAVCIPSYIAYYAWGLLRPPGSWLGDWIAEARGRAVWARRSQAYLGMVCWVWPLVALCVASVAARLPRAQYEQMLIDPCPAWRRAFVAMRETWIGALLGGGVALAFVANSFVSFHLASVPTYAIQLDLLREQAASPAQLGLAGAPLALLSVLGGLFLFVVIRRSADAELAIQPPPVPRSIAGLFWLTWSISFIGPVALMVRALGSWSAAQRGLGDSGAIDAIVGSLAVAGLAGTGVALLCFSLILGWSDRRCWVRRLTTIHAILWLMAGLLPGTIIAMALGAAYNRAWSAWVYGSGLIVVFAHIARYGLIATLLARFAAAREPATLRRLREIDGATTLMGRVRSNGPWLIGPVAAAGILAAVLSVGEVATTVALTPPGSSLLGEVLLNQLHYAREDVVLATCMLLFVIVLVVSLVLGGGYRAWRRWAGVALLLLALLVVPACEREADRADTIFEPDLVFGSSGYGDGQFAYPRVITIDHASDWIYVIDKTGRVQRFDMDGRFQVGWRMPQVDMGKPTGASVGPDGNLWVADTHEHRVAIFSPEGELLRAFGSYGMNEGEFIYPTDVAFGPDGRVFVSEYGGNDRISVWTSEGEPRGSWGSFGHVPEGDESSGVLFARPQCMALDPTTGEIFVTDVSNHRVVVLDETGHVLRAFGRPGTGPGELRYPYGIARLPDGSVIVAEYGNVRLQRFSAAGASLAIYGGPGHGPGQLGYPWAVAADGYDVYVLDSGNNRVQRFAVQ